MESLPDYLDHGLDIVVVGQNPSPASIERQCYYGNPRNRFWPACRRAGLVPTDFMPGPEGLAWLRDHERIGFTDIVKRPTPGTGDLRAADFRAGAPVLDAHLRTYRPHIIWFNGKGVYTSYLRYGCTTRPDTIELGEQPAPRFGATVVVTPNPSPANAAYRLDDLVAWYGCVAALHQRIGGIPHRRKRSDGLI